MTVKTVDPLTLKSWLESNEAVLIDVREPAEYASEHIEGSQPVPLRRVIKDAIRMSDDQKLVIHCRRGGRGQSACEKLLSQMPNVEIYNLAGGIEAWEAAGLNVKKSERRILPLDRQVQLTVGLVLLTTSLLGAHYGAGFFLLTGLIGTGLTFAGLTGFCGLARLLTLMPWNR